MVKTSFSYASVGVVIGRVGGRRAWPVPVAGRCRAVAKRKPGVVALPYGRVLQRPMTRTTTTDP